MQSIEEKNTPSYLLRVFSHAKEQSFYFLLSADLVGLSLSYGTGLYNSCLNGFCSSRNAGSREITFDRTAVHQIYYLLTTVRRVAQSAYFINLRFTRITVSIVYVMTTARISYGPLNLSIVEFSQLLRIHNIV